MLEKESKDANIVQEDTESKPAYPLLIRLSKFYLLRSKTILVTSSRLQGVPIYTLSYRTQSWCFSLKSHDPPLLPLPEKNMTILEDAAVLEKLHGCKERIRGYRQAQTLVSV